MHHTEYVPSLHILPPPALTISAAMSDLEQHSFASHPSISNLVHEFSSLDMNPTAEEAYSQALVSSSQSHRHHPVVRGESAPPAVNSVSSHNDFLQLLARFHQVVTPLPDQPGAYITDPDNQDPAPSIKPKKSRSTARPSRRSSSPVGSSKKVTIPRVFGDMNSLLKRAEEMIDFMRADVEEVMRRSRKLDRESRERERFRCDDDVDMKIDGGREADEAEPLVRKVPVATRFSPHSHASWYSPRSTTPEVQDHSMSMFIAPAPRRIITPRRIRHRLTNSDSASSVSSGFHSIISTLDESIPAGFPTHLALPDRPPHIPWMAQDSILASPMPPLVPLPQVEKAHSPIPMDDVDSCSNRLINLRLAADNATKDEDWDDLEAPPLSTSPTSTVSSAASILSSPPEPTRIRPTRTRSNAISGGSLSNINPIRMYSGYDHPPKPKSFSFSGGISGIMGTTSPSGIAL
ncbi:hypothetical protein FRC02_009802 [Tulasnella sp. 418]|nr:hypothetical protein FRC02_009802 [Tulasnella sp. 418]